MIMRLLCAELAGIGASAVLAPQLAAFAHWIAAGFGTEAAGYSASHVRPDDVPTDDARSLLD
jgi:hypothetical protein